MSTTRYPLVECLLIVIIFIICLVPAIYIFIRERRNRKENLLFPSKYLSLFSYSVILLVPIWIATNVLLFLPGICLISRNVSFLLEMLTWGSLEYYQLSRLYYCFSADKVHSKKGYPKCAFVLIGSTVAVVMIISLLNHFALLGVTTQCGVRRDGEGYSVQYIPFESGVMSDLLDTIGWLPILMRFGIDLSILTLYWCKARSLVPRNGKLDGQNRAHIRIRLILNRVIVLSFFYLIITFWALVIVAAVSIIHAVLDEEEGVWFILHIYIVWNISVLSYSYSVYLMQDHNTIEYIQFLSILSKYKLYFCCCCCYGMIRDQYQFILDNKEEPHLPKSHSISTLDTRNISEYAAGKTELSIATKTEGHVVEDKE